MVDYLKYDGQALRTLIALDIPEVISGDFNCATNLLTSLEFGPKEVGQGYYCSSNRLTSLKFGPVKVGESFICYDNKLTSLEFCPISVGQNFSCHHNKITNLKNIHKHFKNGYIGNNLLIQNNLLKSHMLGVILIPKLQIITLGDEKLGNILNKYIRSTRDVLDCQEELIQKGFKEFAQL